MFAFFRQWRTGHVCTETDSRRGENGTRHRQGLFSLINCRCKGIHRCGRYPEPMDLSAEEGKKVPTFRSSQAWRPSTYERAHSSFVPLTTHSRYYHCCYSRRYNVPSCGPQVAGRYPVVLLNEKNVSCDIKVFVDTPLCELRGILRSRVLWVICDLVKNVRPC